MNERHQAFLEGLRAGGTTSMFAAERYLAAAFDLSVNEARGIVLEWVEKRRSFFS